MSSRGISNSRPLSAIVLFSSSTRLKLWTLYSILKFALTLPGLKMGRLIICIRKGQAERASLKEKKKWKRKKKWVENNKSRTNVIIAIEQTNNERTSERASERTNQRTNERTIDAKLLRKDGRKEWYSKLINKSMKERGMEIDELGRVRNRNLWVFEKSRGRITIGREWITSIYDLKKYSWL